MKENKYSDTALDLDLGLHSALEPEQKRNLWKRKSCVFHGGFENRLSIFYLRDYLKG
jgi:hypothetical protein